MDQMEASKQMEYVKSRMQEKAVFRSYYVYSTILFSTSKYTEFYQIM